MGAGWIKLHRELMDKGIWTSSTSDQKVILLTLLMMASHTNRKIIWKNEVINLLPGQFITSLPNISRESGTSVQTVRTALKKFVKHEFLTDCPTVRGRLITIVNWEFYQGTYLQKTDTSTDNQQTTNRQSTDNQQTTNRQLTAIKNEELEFKELALESSSSSSSRSKKKDDDDDDGEEIKKQIQEEFKMFQAKDVETAVSLAKEYGARDVKKYALQILWSRKTENINGNGNGNGKGNVKSKFANFKERENIDFEELRRLEDERIRKELKESYKY